MVTPPPPAVPKKKLIVIEQGLLAAMARNPKFIKAFPFLSALARTGTVKKRGCGTCGRAASDLAAAYSSAKRAIAGLAADKKRALKDLLNTEKARINFTDPATRKVKELTF